MGVEVNPGNVHDSTAFNALYEKVTERFPEIEVVTADAAYKTPWICKRILDAGRYHVRNADRPAVSPGRFAVRRGTGADHCPLHRHVAKRPIPKRRGVD